MCHHCAGCKKTFQSRCLKKEHMVECPFHPGAYSLPNKRCATCVDVEEAAARERPNREQANKKKY
ncbi:hypothetical protein F5B17DRAFT_428158 [Nemania serpens]|nr:hypothetical protein F5B17DRAFT_428158 [Nemania serpens]